MKQVSRVADVEQLHHLLNLAELFPTAKEVAEFKSRSCCCNWYLETYLRPECAFPAMHSSALYGGPGQSSGAQLHWVWHVLGVGQEPLHGGSLQSLSTKLYKSVVYLLTTTPKGSCFSSRGRLAQ